MTLHLGFPHAHHRSTEQQQEVREARRLLKERIRNDWDYPPLPAYQVPVNGRNKREEKVAGFRFHIPSNHDRQDAPSNVLGFEPVEWRERDYSSDSDSDNESVATTTSKSSKGSKNFKFEGPDSVGLQLENRRLAGKRKRQKALDEELGWNDGLQHWMSRRDVWCAARSISQINVVDSKEEHAYVASNSTSANSTPRTSTSSRGTDPGSSVEATSSAATTPDPAPITLSMPTPSREEVLIPIVPKILANHPVRRRIDPKMYPEIYNKIILQSRTPSVPINLVALTKALVQGWKDDGEWPPKPGVLEKPVARKKVTGGHGIKDGVKAVGRVLRITGSETSGSVKEKGRRDEG